MSAPTHPPAKRHKRLLVPHIDRAGLASVALLGIVALLSPDDLQPTVNFAADALLHTSAFIAFAILAVGYLKASGAESLLARAFSGHEVRMIFLAALLGGLSPFCSCEVIPFIAAALAVGAPLSAVMAFWLASPLMDPAMFLITAGTLGTGFAVAKAIAAVSLGLFGGFGVWALRGSRLFRSPLRRNSAPACGASEGISGRPFWAFWREGDRIKTFRHESLTNALFLIKWLVLAYLLEAVMIQFIPSGLIAQTLGGNGIRPIFLGALIGGPAYLNGYAAVPLIAGLIRQGMSQGAAMSFVLAGGVSCIPAAVAVWALVKPRVFFAYLGFAFTGSLMAGFIWAALQ